MKRATKRVTTRATPGTKRVTTAARALVRGTALTLTLGAASLTLPLGRSPALATESLSQEALLEQGFVALRAQRPTEALFYFKQARFLSVSARAVGGMGLAEEALAHWIDAEQDLSQALSFTQDSWVKTDKETLTSALERVQRHVGALRVVGGPPGTIVMIGDRSLAQLPMTKAVRLAAGKIHISLVPPAGFKAVETDVEIGVGAPTDVTLSCSKR